MTGRPTAARVRVASLFVLLFAVAPNALFMGHWHIFAPAPEPQAPSSASLAIHVHPAATTSEEEQATEQAHERAGHCPSGPSRCSSAPAVPVIPFTEAGVVVLVLGAGLLMLLERSTISALDPDVLPLRRPPRRTLHACSA